MATNGRAKRKKEGEAKKEGSAEKKPDQNPVIEGLGVTFNEALKNQNLVCRLGRLPLDGVWKLKLFDGKLFTLYTFDSDDEYNWCAYFAAKQDIHEADSVFNGLVFERIVIPAEQLSADGAFGRISELVAADKANHRKTLSQKAKGEGGIGSFIIENFFELFEVVLSFITNTMSFLRVGGFILSHAGMMAVVMTLSEMVGEGASPVVVVIGNLFVLGMEGLIVGIQSLRLEFYEIFSRFFEGDGKPFTPISVGNAQNE